MDGHVCLSLRNGQVDSSRGRPNVSYAPFRWYTRVRTSTRGTTFESGVIVGCRLTHGIVKLVALSCIERHCLSRKLYHPSHSDTAHTSASPTIENPSVHSVRTLLQCTRHINIAHRSHALTSHQHRTSPNNAHPPRPTVRHLSPILYSGCGSGPPSSRSSRSRFSAARILWRRAACDARECQWGSAHQLAWRRPPSLAWPSPTRSSCGAGSTWPSS